MKARLLCIALAMLLLLGGMGVAETPSGQIYLYGEQHANQAILDMELEIWRDHYARGMRHLFIEVGYFTAEYLNEWMRMESDYFLEMVYADWQGTQSHNPVVLAFYRQIKADCPETVFHGTDVGHQYDTTGKKYLLHLQATSRGDTDQYALAQEVIEQGKRFYRDSDGAYREDMMAANFIRAFDALGGEDVMGIYGGAHVDIGAMDYSTRSVPSMASQLAAHYGDAVHAENLGGAMAQDIAPLRTDTVDVGGVAYEALYFGQQDLTGFKSFATRDFWRLEGAYDAMKGLPTTGDTLPYDNYPMSIEQGQVFLIEYTMTDGSAVRLYYRADGNTFDGRPTTEGFVIE